LCVSPPTRPRVEKRTNAHQSAQRRTESPEKVPNNVPQTFIAELIGDSAATAAGITVTNTAPVLALCRALVDAGVDHGGRLEAYRGKVLALRVRSISEVARLDINSKGTGFVRRRSAVRTASPVRVSGREASR